MADQSAGEAAKGCAGLANTGRVKGDEAPTRHFNFRPVDARRFRFLTDNNELAIMIIKLAKRIYTFFSKSCRMTDRSS